MKKNVVTIISPSNDTRILEYLAAFVTSHRAGDTIEVKRIASQTATTSADQLRLLSVLLLAHSSSHNITKSLYSETKIYSYTGLAKICDEREEHAAHGRLKTTKFELHCRCSRPYLKTLTTEESKTLEVSRLIACQKCEKVWEQCQKRDVPQNTRNLKWTCDYCTPFMPVHLWLAEGCTNTCSLDSFLAILLHHTLNNTDFIKYVHQLRSITSIP